MVEPPAEGETLREIAVRHGRAYNTLRNQWSRDPVWPDPIGKRGRSKLYDPATVDRVIAEHFARQGAELEPRRLYTAREIEALTGVTAATIRADLSRSRKPGQRRRWPEPDDTDHGVNRWYGETVTTALTARRGYRRSAEG